MSLIRQPLSILRRCSSYAGVSAGRFQQLRGGNRRKKSRPTTKPTDDGGRLLYQRIDPFYYRFAVPVAIGQATMTAVLTLLISRGQKKDQRDTPLDDHREKLMEESGKQEKELSVLREKDMDESNVGQSRYGSMMFAATAGFAAFILYGSVALTNKRVVALRAFDRLRKVRIYTYDLFGRKQLRMLSESDFGQVKVNYAKLRFAGQLRNTNVQTEQSVIVLHNGDMWFTIDASSCDCLDIKGIEGVATNQVQKNGAE